MFDQAALNDLVRDLDLPKDKAELMGSRLQERNLLQPGVSFSWYRHRKKEFSSLFSDKDFMVYCNNVQSLVEKFGIEYDPQEWRFFIDSSKRSLKGVLLYNGNKYASFPIFHSVQLKECYTNMKTVLECVAYEEHKWKIYGDLKVICMLLQQQSGYTKFPCFLCEWDRGQSKRRTLGQKRLALEEIASAGFLEYCTSSANRSRNSIATSIGIGMKQFVKALDKESRCFKYLADIFPSLSYLSKNKRRCLRWTSNQNFDEGC